MSNRRNSLSRINVKNSNNQIAKINDLQRLNIGRSHYFYQLPLASFFFAAKSFITGLKSRLLPQSISIEEAQKEIDIANQEKDILNAMKLQRIILKAKNKILSAIRRNETLVMLKIGHFDSESKVLAGLATTYFKQVGIKDVNQTNVNGSLYLYLEIQQEEF